MKRLALVLLVWLGGIVGAAAACTGPAVMHDFPGTSFNMSLATVPDGNCGSNVALPTWAGGTLGAMANYGTSPGAVLVPGVNAFITNTPAVTQSGTWTVQPGNTPNTTPWLVSSNPGITSTAGTGWTSGTAGNTTQAIMSSGGWPAILVQLNQTSTISGGAVTFEGTYDGSNWVTIPVAQLLNPNTFATLTNPYTLVQSTNQPFLILTQGYQQVRLKLSTVITGSATVTPQITLLPYNPTIGALLNPLVAGSAIIGKTGIDQTTKTVTNGVMNAGSTYNHVAASQTAQAMTGGGGGAAGDYLSHCVIYPSTTGAGSVTVFDNTNSAANNVIEFTTGTLSNLVPITLPVGAISVNGAWKVTTGANETAVCYGKFT